MTASRVRPPLTVIRSGDFVDLRSGDEPGGLFRSTLDLPGGSLTYDVRDLAAAPAADVHDTVGATHWLSRVYGQPAMDAIESLGSGITGAEPSRREVAWFPEDTAFTLARIALGQWLWRFWPVSRDDDPPAIDEALLRIELAALAWQADDFFTALQPAPTLLTGTLPTLSDAAEALASDPRSASTPLGTVVVGALEAILIGPGGAVITEDEQLLDRLDDLYRRITEDWRGDHTLANADNVIATAAEDWLSTQASRRAAITSTARQSDYALTAGGDQADRPTGQVGGQWSVDWAQVPPRTLEWEEGTVVWTAEPSKDSPDSWTVTVQVSAAPDPEERSPKLLLARGYLPDGTLAGDLPVLAIPLSREGDHYVGAGTLRESRLRDQPLVIDIYSATAVRRPAIGAQQQAAARRERREARAFIRNRCLSGQHDPDDPGRPFQAEPQADG